MNLLQPTYALLSISRTNLIICYVMFEVFLDRPKKQKNKTNQIGPELEMRPIICLHYLKEIVLFYKEMLAYSLLF